MGVKIRKSGKNMSDDVVSDIKKPIEEVKKDIENLSGPIKRQF